MNTQFLLRFSSLSVWTALLLLANGLSSDATATPLTLANAPAGNGGREPAPNIIVSVDDSGSMGTAGVAALKTALNNAFSTSAVTDDTIRVAFQAMWRCRGLSATPYKNYGGACPDNRMKPFSGAHRNNFNNWVDSLTPSSNTPSHLMIKNAGEYMKTTGIWNPYAKNPGLVETPLLACRKSFQIFMTDGEWNSESSYGNDPSTAGNADGSTRTLPDGTVYDVAAANTQTRIYRDRYGVGTVNTVSDFVFDYWSTDLQPGIPNEVRPIIRQPGSVNFGTVAAPYWLEEYWNPRNNPATWQSLVTYTIGFGSGATLSTSTAPKWGGATGTTWSGGDYEKLVQGLVPWGDPINSAAAKRQELWHMAINGRGRYVPANNAADLSAAFAEIVNQILLDTSNPLVAITANTQTLSTTTRAYVAGYDATKWSGHVRAYSLTSSAGVSAIPVWDAAVQLESKILADRLIFTHDGSVPASFTWSALSNTQKVLLQGTDSVAVGQNRLTYLRGDRTLEIQSGGTFRNRDKRLGDIVGSSLWSVAKPDMGYSMNNYRTFRAAKSARTPMIYVGANDGMLHGFSATDGSEKIAYVPFGVYGNLAAYSSSGYTHRFFVDGQPFTGDFFDGTDWQTVLIGTLAGGGKGYFGLNVTNPDSWTSTSASSLVLMDKTNGADDDIGHIYGEPTLDTANAARTVQMTKLNNGRWAVLMGNGVNSSSEKSVLLIQYLDGAKELVKLFADNTGANGNGLANPQVIDVNGDGKADIVYAGDLLGNLWKFDLTSAASADWNVAFSGTPLFVARDTAGARQPITTAPTWVAHPIGGYMLGFGTGREMTEGDRTNVSLQTMYGVWDNTSVAIGMGSVTLSGGAVIPDTSPGYGRSLLVQQTQTATLTIAGKTFFKTSTNTVPYTGVGAKRGWYLDWPGLGERTVANPSILDKRLMKMPSRKLAVGSQTQSSEETCTPDATPPEEYETLINLLTGKPLTTPAFDTDGGGFTGTEEAGVSRWKAGTDSRLWLRVGRLDGKNNESVSIGPRNNDSMRVRTGAIQPEQLGWRQLQ